MGMASGHSEGTLTSQHHQSPRPTAVYHQTLCVLLRLMCLARDCSEICGGISVEFSRKQCYSYKISPELRRIFCRVLRRTLRRSASPANFAAYFATKLRREVSPSEGCCCCSAFVTFTLAALSLMCWVFEPCSQKQ